MDNSQNISPDNVMQDRTLIIVIDTASKNSVFTLFHTPYKGIQISANRNYYIII